MGNCTSFRQPQPRARKNRNLQARAPGADGARSTQSGAALACPSSDRPRGGISNDLQASTMPAPATPPRASRNNRNLQGRAINAAPPSYCGAANGFVFAPAQPSHAYFSGSHLSVVASHAARRLLTRTPCSALLALLSRLFFCARIASHQPRARRFCSESQSVRSRSSLLLQPAPLYFSLLFTMALCSAASFSLLCTTNLPSSPVSTQHSLTFMDRMRREDRKLRKQFAPNSDQQNVSVP